MTLMNVKTISLSLSQLVDDVYCQQGKAEYYKLYFCCNVSLGIIFFFFCSPIYRRNSRIYAAKRKNLSQNDLQERIFFFFEAVEKKSGAKRNESERIMFTYPRNVKSILAVTYLSFRLTRNSFLFAIIYIPRSFSELKFKNFFIFSFLFFN